MRKTSDYKTSATGDLVRKFAEFASDRGSALRAANPKRANALYREMQELHREIRGRGTEAQHQMLPLLQDKNADIRSAAAYFALEFDPQAAQPVLEKLAEEQRNFLGFTAGMVLQQWKEGKLRFP